MPKLRELDLSDNNISLIAAKAFAGLSQLLYLRLSSNKLRTESLEAGWMTGLEKLQILRMNKNLFTTLKREMFSLMNTLTELHLIGNKIVVIEDNAFQGEIQRAFF